MTPLTRYTHLMAAKLNAALHVAEDKVASALDALHDPQVEALDPSLDQALTAALTRAPRTAIPTDFAARVAASLPAHPARRRSARLGRSVAIALGASGLIAALCLAPHSAPSFTSVAFDTELLLFAEAAGICTLLALRWREV